MSIVLKTNKGDHTHTLKEQIELARTQIREGRFYTSEQICRELGI